MIEHTGGIYPGASYQAKETNGDYFIEWLRGREPMSCYFRHMKDILDAADVVVTKENKKEIDRIIHNLVNVEYKNCPTTWRVVEEQIKGDEETKRRFIIMLKEELKG